MRHTAFCYHQLTMLTPFAVFLDLDAFRAVTGRNTLLRLARNRAVRLRGARSSACVSLGVYGPGV